MISAWGVATSSQPHLMLTIHEASRFWNWVWPCCRCVAKPRTTLSTRWEQSATWLPRKATIATRLILGPPFILWEHRFASCLAVRRSWSLDTLRRKILARFQWIPADTLRSQAFSRRHTLDKLDRREPLSTGDEVCAFNASLRGKGQLSWSLDGTSRVRRYGIWDAETGEQLHDLVVKGPADRNPHFAA